MGVRLEIFARLNGCCDMAHVACIESLVSRHKCMAGHFYTETILLWYSTGCCDFVYSSQRSDMNKKKAQKTAVH